MRRSEYMEFKKKMFASSMALATEKSKEYASDDDAFINIKMMAKEKYGSDSIDNCYQIVDGLWLKHLVAMRLQRITGASPAKTRERLGDFKEYSDILLAMLDEYEKAMP